MCRFRNKSRGLLPLLLPGLLCLWSCGFMDLRPIGLSIVPGEEDALLPDPKSPVILRFDTPMEEAETGRILRVSSGGGETGGDLLWEGNSLLFVPRGGWLPGTRYLLSLSGTVYAGDGRELRLESYRHFFAVSRAPAPRLESASPPGGASIPALPGGSVILELRFSLPMDPQSTGEDLSFEGAAEKRLEWLDDDRVLRLRSPAPLQSWTSCRWTLGTGARSREGVPLPRAYTGQFSTAADRLIPEVLGAFPLRRSGGTWVPRGEGLDPGPGFGEGIGLEFNKPMDGESLLRALRFEPALSGRVEQTGPRFLAFIPEGELEPETAYTLYVAADTRDEGGLKLGTEYRFPFHSDIPRLRLLSLKPGGGAVLGPEELAAGGAHPLPVDVPGGGVVRLVLRFSLPFETGPGAGAALRPSLDSFFPEDLPPVSLRAASWPLSDTLLLDWEGLKPGSPGEPHYYRLLIPGGRGGIGTGKGSFLKEDILLYLEAVE